MEYKVTGCAGCPMFNANHDDKYGWIAYCGHPNFIDKGIIEEISFDAKGDPTTPENCPLNKEPITIIKDNEQETKNYAESILGQQ